MLGQYQQAGGTTAEFRRETQRTAISAIRAYQRRRGWAAWNTAALQRFDFASGFPTIGEMMGAAAEAAAAPRQTAPQRRHVLKMWRAAIAVPAGEAGKMQ